MADQALGTAFAVKFRCVDQPHAERQSYPQGIFFNGFRMSSLCKVPGTLTYSRDRYASRNLTLRPSLFDKSPFVPATADWVASAVKIPIIGGSDKPNAKQRALSSRRVSKCSMFNSSITNTAFLSRYRTWLCHGSLRTSFDHARAKAPQLINEFAPTLQQGR